MTSVFVHGVPEDRHLWDDLRAELTDRSTVALGLPGFGEPVPQGFEATKEAYVAWLVGELERFDDPVDLVGHDWGGGLVGRVAFTRPDLIRTWAIDTPQFFNPRSKWHDLARKWQTPDVGEQVMAYQDALDEERRVALLVSAGMTEQYARHVAPVDPLRNRCILSLYRSAVDVFKEWARSEPSSRPAIYLAGAHDQYASHELGKETAHLLNMKVAVFEDLGHWWALHDPARGAVALRAFWEAAYAPAQTSST
jgi:pimeloyl-ACP methyl ester carboxylesterase